MNIEQQSFKINWEALASDLAVKSVECDKLLNELLESGVFKDRPDLRDKVTEFIKNQP